LFEFFAILFALPVAAEFALNFSQAVISAAEFYVDLAADLELMLPFLPAPGDQLHQQTHKDAVEDGAKQHLQDLIE